MANAQECRRQAAECTKLRNATTKSNLRPLLSSMTKSWTVLANQMDRLHDLDPVRATHLALPR